MAIQVGDSWVGLNHLSPYPPPGEVRAHLLPSKAGRVRTPGSLSGANLQPPPLPRKALTRTQSLPTGATPGRSSSRAGHAQRPLLGARSVDESQAEAGPVVRTPVELTSSVAELALGLHLKDLHSPVAVHAALTAQQLHGLRGIHTQLRARLTGGRPGPCSPSHSFRLLDTSPCLESGDACYYRVVRVLGDAWHVVAAKVSFRGSCHYPSPCLWGSCSPPQELLHPTKSLSSKSGGEVP